MYEDLIGAYGGRLVVAAVGVGLALLCLIGILWIVRGRRGPSPFVRGGRNRQPRLQVLDAAAVDTRRRLVLVRRDDVEHLIMIGGPTDIVIESRIPPSAKITETRLPEAPATPAIAASPAPTPTLVKPSAAPAALPVQPRPEPARETMVRDTRLQQPIAAAQAQPAPISPIAITPAPVRVEPTIPEVAATAPPPTGSAISSTPRDTRVAPAVAAPALDDAARLLDNARDRVFAERGPTDRTNSPAVPSPSARPAPPVGDHPKALGSDFERILEQEMATDLAARDTSMVGRAGQQPAQSIAVNGPVAPIPGAAKIEPSLQTEVARIFGEMSASRDK